jgi:hypothetical protein
MAKFKVEWSIEERLVLIDILKVSYIRKQDSKKENI